MTDLELLLIFSVWTLLIFCSVLMFGLHMAYNKIDKLEGEQDELCSMGNN